MLEREQVVSLEGDSRELLSAREEEEEEKEVWCNRLQSRDTQRHGSIPLAVKSRDCLYAKVASCGLL